jgi:hypothetical protein
MNTKVMKAESVMTKALEKAGISHQGKLWLEHVLDPFKDLPTPCSGFPDTNMANSVVAVVKNSIVISTNAGTSTWDCNIFTDTSSTTASQYLTATAAGNVFLHAGQGATPYLRGGVVIRKAAAGTALETTTTTSNITLPTTYFTNRSSRVIATGFEKQQQQHPT